MTEQSRCTRCGTPLAPGARFCSRCGFDVSGEQGRVTTAASAEDDPQAGLIEELRHATLGDYEIAGELGRGGMATVYLAHEIALERKVAIKVMSPALLSSGKGMADRFKREARTAAALSHPHIIPIYGVRQSGRLLYFIMKFVQGRSLDAIIKEHGALPIKMVQAILAQAGGALDYAHRHGIIHRDIKPANIMLDVDGWAVVTDFGIAKVTQSQGLTMTGATIGTPTYMSPEQCAAREITGASDQYSLGIAAYEMITGRVPFDADSVMSLMWQHFHEPPRPILEQRPDCPPDLARAIERMLAKAPADRWPNLEEAVEAIGTPAHNDPIRQQMRALARGSGASHVVTEHHTPVSPVPIGTSAPTTPIPAARDQAPPPPTPHIAPMPPPALPVTPLEPISPTSEELAESPTSVIETPKPATRTPAPPPPPARPAAPKPPRRSTGTVSAATPARAEPAPVIPPPFSAARRGTAVRLVGPAAGLVVLGVIAWLVFGRGSQQPPSSLPATPTAVPVATVDVTPSPAAVTVGKTAQLTAVMKDGRGNLLSGRPVTWSSTDSNMARVSTTGLVTAVSPGLVTVTAMSEGQAGIGTIIITATASPVARLRISQPTATIEVGDTITLRASPQDDLGHILVGREMTWSSSDRRVAAVSASGTISGQGLGTTMIVATVGEKRDSARLTVVPPAVAIVIISPPSLSLQVGNRRSLSAAARDRHNRRVEGRPVDWRSSAPSVASVSAQGVVAALRAGPALIHATIDSQSDSITVMVNAIPVARVVMVPDTLRLAVGKTQQLRATLQDTHGGILVDRDVQWSSSNESVVTVSNGMVTAISAGNATVTATSGAASGAATVTVPAPPPQVVTPTVKTDSQPVSPPPSANPTASTVSSDAAAARAMPRTGVTSGAVHSCGITENGAASCWGGNSTGQLGDPQAGPQALHPLLVDQPGGFRMLAAGTDYTCGITTTGDAFCWGANVRGQLGIGRTGASAGPTPVAGNHNFTWITAGAQHACGLAAEGAAWCWGANNDGQLGTGNTRPANTPQRVTGGWKFKSMAAGGKHTCGLTYEGKAYCWGDGFSGQLGRGNRERLTEPAPVEVNIRFTMITAGTEHTCGLAQGGKIYCWGANVAGEVGDGSRLERDAPVAIAYTGSFSVVEAGSEHTCALTNGGDAFCWGRNREGQLGDGTKTDHSAPVKAAGNQTFQSISVGGGHSCAVSRDQGVFCWGANARGQLGDGTVSSRSTPVSIETRP